MTPALGIGMTSQRTRERLVERIRRHGVRDPRVLERILNTPRHLFVDEALASRAYEDTALPIGKGQTISQPYIVARMTEALQLSGKEYTLEIGTGSGYQTALLSLLADEVFSMERLPELAEQARCRLADFGYEWAKDCYHLSYGMVYLPEGKMKSREGKIVDADDLIAEMKKLAAEEIRQRDPEKSGDLHRWGPRTRALSRETSRSQAYTG